jgi:hypothetical protein
MVEVPLPVHLELLLHPASKREGPLHVVRRHVRVPGAIDESLEMVEALLPRTPGPASE